MPRVHSLPPQARCANLVLTNALTARSIVLSFRKDIWCIMPVKASARNDAGELHLPLRPAPRYPAVGSIVMRHRPIYS